MFYDLNVPWDPTSPDLPRTVAFLDECYNVIALSHTHSGKFPQNQQAGYPTPTSAYPAIDILLIPSLQPIKIPENPFPNHPGLRVLRRITVVLSDPSQNHQLASLTAAYDLVALRPTNEKLLFQACKDLECDLISIDLSQRLAYNFKHKVVGIALQRGIFLEINYSASLTDVVARRNLVGNAAALIRAARGRGIVISSGARKALGIRAPFDVVNLATLWGLSQEKGREAVGELARTVVVQAGMKRSSYRGAIDVIVADSPNNNKRKAESEGGDPSKDGKAESSLDKGKRKNEDASATESQDPPPPPKLLKRARKDAARARTAAVAASEASVEVGVASGS